MSDQTKENMVDNTSVSQYINDKLPEANVANDNIAELQPEVQNFEYEREDSDEGVITNIPEITQLQATHITDVIYNGLMGDYDDHGGYSIDEDITKELAHLPKHFVRKDKFGTYVQGSIGEQTFEFCITPHVIKEDGNAYCYLQLLEEVSYTNGYIIDTKTTTIATYEYTYSDVFNDLVLRAFNVDQDTEGEPQGGREYINKDHIMLRLKYLQAVADMSMDLYEVLDEAYFNKRIQILNSLPEGTVILAEFNRERAKIEKFFVVDNQRKYKALNDLLNSILDGPAGEKIKENAEYNNKMAEVNQTYLNKVSEINHNVTQSHDIQLLIQQEKPMQKIGFDNDLPKNVSKGEKYAPPKKSKGKSRPPSVPKPDKYSKPKAPKSPKAKDKDTSSSLGLDVWNKYKRQDEVKKPNATEPQPTLEADVDLGLIYRK